MLCTSRPGSDFDEICASIGNRLLLERLNDSECMLLAGQAAVNRLSPDLLGKILPRAGGNPLFVEEFVDMLLESAGANDPARLDSIPVTIEGLVQSKIDRLDKAARKLAEAGSVIGNRFDVRLAGEAAGLSGDEHDDAVTVLDSAGLLEAADFEHRFEIRRFDHALIRDAIEASLTHGKRIALHGRIADSMQTSDDGSIRTSVLLAQHLASAERPQEAAEGYFVSAAASANAGNAAEALSKIDKGLEQVQLLEPNVDRDAIELRLRAVQAPMRMVTRGPGSPVFGESQAQALELLRRLEIREQMVPVLYNSALHEWARGNFDKASAHADELAMVVDAAPDDSGQMAANTMKGLIAWHRGDNLEAQTRLRATIEIYDPNKHRDLYMAFLKEFGVFARFYLALTETVLGDADSGRRLALDALELGREVRRPHAIGFGLLANFLTAMLRGDVDAAAQYSAESMAYSGEQHFPEFVAMSRFCQGWTQCLEGRRKQGLLLMQSGTDQWIATGFQSWSALFRSMIAEQQVTSGDMSSAEESIAIVAAAIERHGEHQFDAPLACARIRLALARGDKVSADEERRQASERSAATNASLWADTLSRLPT